MLSNLVLEITYWHRPIWGLGLIARSESWTLTPAETMNDSDVYELAQKFINTGSEVNVVEEIKCASAT